MDPHSLETLWISVICFQTDAFALTPLTPICDFDARQMPTALRSNLAALLRFQAAAVDQDLVPAQDGAKGDWKPEVVVISTKESAIKDISALIVLNEQQKWQRWTTVVLVDGTVSGAYSLADTVEAMPFDPEDEAFYDDFFRWPSVYADDPPGKRGI